MKTNIFRFFAVTILGLLAACSTVSSSGVEDVAAEPESFADTADLRTAVFAGGCFWGVEAVFEHLRGVKSARSGYAGGEAKSAKYDDVSEGDTGHAESVEVTFDPTQISYEQLLDVFFKVAHDPTELNRQGPDVGTQYRSVIFYIDDDQKVAANQFIEKLNAAKMYKKPIVTQVVPLEKFYEAEAYHQDYLPRNMTNPYIVYHDLPKLENLKRAFPALYVDRVKNARAAKR